MESLNKASKKSEKTRRCWSQKEEEVLIACLKDIVASGWKADNGFRVGYLDINILHDDFEDEVKEDSTKQPVNNDIARKNGGKKRKSTDGNEGLCELLGSFCRSTKTRLGDIARRIGYDQDVSAATKEVFEAVGKISGLTLHERLSVSKRLVKNTEELELFSSFPEDARAEYVRMMLAEKL